MIHHKQRKSIGLEKKIIDLYFTMIYFSFSQLGCFSRYLRQCRNHPSSSCL